ncbi:hypothetical protein KEM52_005976 [Ascosphaera acerosa]|nr:hypothetical protein KEM52_005976 [Ascosphaera acerosa]
MDAASKDLSTLTTAGKALVVRQAAADTELVWQPIKRPVLLSLPVTVTIIVTVAVAVTTAATGRQRHRHKA